MTHSDIYTKFMIEYDKANITSSYPSLTKYEIATILDKAYLALIAQKFTGNNTRNTAFEGDVKAIEDLQPLITYKLLKVSDGSASNEYKATIPSDMLHYVGSQLLTANKTSSIDNKKHFKQNINIISHHNAYGFMSTTTNLPWIKQPVGYMQGNEFHVLFDGYDIASNDTENSLVEFTYIKKPNMFVIGDNKKEDESNEPIIIPSPDPSPDLDPEPDKNPTQDPDINPSPEPDYNKTIETDMYGKAFPTKFYSNTPSVFYFEFDDNISYIANDTCFIISNGDNTVTKSVGAYISNKKQLWASDFLLSKGEYTVTLSNGSVFQTINSIVYSNKTIKFNISVTDKDPETIVSPSDPRYDVYGFPGEYAPTGYDGDLHEWIDYVDMPTCSGYYWAPVNIGSKSSYGTDKWYSWGETISRSETPTLKQYQLASRWKYLPEGGVQIPNPAFDYSNPYDEQNSLYPEMDKKYFPYENDNQKKFWRMPTATEMSQLFNGYYGKGVYTTFKGVKGVQFNDKLFFPIPKSRKTQSNPNDFHENPNVVYTTGYWTANTIKDNTLLGGLPNEYARSVRMSEDKYVDGVDFGKDFWLEQNRWAQMQIRPVYTGRTDVTYSGPKKKGIKAVVFDFDTPEKYGVTKTNASENVTSKTFVRGPISVMFDSGNGSGAHLQKYGNNDVLQLCRQCFMKIQGSNNVKLLEIQFHKSSINGDIHLSEKQNIGIANNKNIDWLGVGYGGTYSYKDGWTFKWSSQEEYKTDIRIDNNDGSATITDGWVELENPIVTNYTTFFQSGEPSEITSMTIFYQEV